MKGKAISNIAGNILIDAGAAFLNGAGLASGEDKNTVIPKTFWEQNGPKKEEVPYVSAQSWRRWLRNTTNEENNWDPSELKSIDTSEKGSTNKISTELNPVDYPEDDIFGYMRAGKGKEESVQRTSAFKCSILKGIPGKRKINTDEGFVHLKEGTPLPYSTKFYASALEGFFNLECYRLGVYDNLGSKVELAAEILKEVQSKLKEEDYLEKFKRYTLNEVESLRKERSAGLLRGLVHLRGGAKQAAFGADVSPKVIVLAGLSSANPIFNNLFSAPNSANPVLNVVLLKELAKDYKDKLSTPIYVGIRTGYLENEEEVVALDKGIFSVDSPIETVSAFIKNHLS